MTWAIGQLGDWVIVRRLDFGVLPEPPGALNAPYQYPNIPITQLPN